MTSVTVIYIAMIDERRMRRRSVEESVTGRTAAVVNSDEKGEEIDGNRSEGILEVERK